MLKDETLCTGGHLPQEISKKCFFFVRRGGVFGVEVTGPRQKSTQPDIGMEIPCMLTFTCEDLHTLEKAKELLLRRGFKPKDHPKAEGHLATLKRIRAEKNPD